MSEIYEVRGIQYTGNMGGRDHYSIKITIFDGEGKDNGHCYGMAYVSPSHNGKLNFEVAPDGGLGEVIRREFPKFLKKQQEKNEENCMIILSR